MAESKEPIEFDLNFLDDTGPITKEGVKEINFGKSGNPKIETTFFNEEKYWEYHEIIKNFVEPWCYQQQALARYHEIFESLQKSAERINWFYEIDVKKTKELSETAQRYENLRLVAEKARDALYSKIPESRYIKPEYLFYWLECGMQGSEVFSGRYGQEIVEAFFEGKEYPKFGTFYDDLEAFGYAVEVKQEKGKICLVRKIERERDSKSEKWREVDKTEVIDERDIFGNVKS